MGKTRKQHTWNMEIVHLYFPPKERTLSMNEVKNAFGEETHPAIRRSINRYKKDLVLLEKETKKTIERIVCTYVGIEKDIWLMMEEDYYNLKKERITKRISQLTFLLAKENKNSKRATQEEIARAKEYSIHTLCKMYGIKVVKNQAHCPFHGVDKKPSIGLKYNRFHCFTCGERGDTIDLTMKMEGIDFTSAVKRLS